MDYKYAYKQLEKEIQGLARSLNNQTRKITDQDELETLPKIFLRGRFEQINIDTGCLEITVESSRYYYPVSQYQSEKLPFPGHQVLIFNDNEQPGIVGFNAQGRMLSPAGIESLQLQKVDIQSRTWTFASHQYHQKVLPLPDELPPLVIGENYQFRVIQCLPHHIYVYEKKDDMAFQHQKNISTAYQSARG
ncbi:hypothetical protein N9R79_06525 [Vibrio sp.]|nr:hypothetical protein [Vibrio sp.]